MDIEDIVRQAFKTLAFQKSTQEREELLALLPELLVYVELLRWEAQRFAEHGALD